MTSLGAKVSFVLKRIFLEINDADFLLIFTRIGRARLTIAIDLFDYSSFYHRDASKAKSRVEASLLTDKGREKQPLLMIRWSRSINIDDNRSCFSFDETPLVMKRFDFRRHPITNQWMEGHKIKTKSKFKVRHQKHKLFRANDPLLSVFMWGVNFTVSRTRETRL